MLGYLSVEDRRSLGGVGPTDLQWDTLLNIVSSDHEMRTNQFVSGPNGKIRLQGKWDDAAIELNAMQGVKKSGQQWKDVSR